VYFTGELSWGNVLKGVEYAISDDMTTRWNGPFDYRDFFTLWKDADPDVPILKQAKAEYAKLQ
jgi:hypothetical protein